MKTYMHILTFLLSALLFYGCDSAEPNKDVHPNITWKVYNIGTAYDTNIKDIFVIDENNIWVVGEIADENTGNIDSTGHVIKPWNLGIWNGEKWELKTLYMKESGQNIYRRLTAIWAFDKNDIWLGNYAYFHWDGNSFTEISIPTLATNDTKAWGNSNRELFIAGEGGGINYFNGSTWTRISTGNSQQLIGMWGTGSYTIYTTYPDYSSGKNRILETNRLGTTDLKWDSTKVPDEIWTDNTNIPWAASDDVYKYEGGAWKPMSFPGSQEASTIRGTSQENIYVTGGERLVAHYNGKSWQTYDIGLREDATFYTLSVKEDVIAFAGYAESGFIVVIGKIS